MVLFASTRRFAFANLRLTSVRKRHIHKVWQYPASDDDETSNGVQYVASDNNKWDQHFVERKDTKFFTKDKISRQVVSHFLPAQYPNGVAKGYLPFATYCFTASVAGSASMVLSTQTLLLAVGVVGSNAQTAGIMAGALNWVLKDFCGQLGGVIFASQMGKTKAFDNDPKRWRMVSAMTLEGATLLEILSPLFHPSMVLPVASIANVGKNIGFLTASASRAAIHQSLAISGNLGDVTAKAGSQSIMASLCGTTLGIGLSSLLNHDAYKFSMGFCVLAVIHQGFNYLSLKNVPLAHFNKQRLYIVLDQYIETNLIPTPSEVAEKETFIPLFGNNKKHDQIDKWLLIGSPLATICPEPSELESVMRINKESYLLYPAQDGKMHLTFFKNATGKDIIRGVLHAFLCQKLVLSKGVMEEAIMLNDSHTQCLEILPVLFDQLDQHGWSTSTETTSIESRNSFRLSIPNSPES